MTKVGMTLEEFYNSDYYRAIMTIMVLTHEEMEREKYYGTPRELWPGGPKMNTWGAYCFVENKSYNVFKCEREKESE